MFVTSRRQWSWRRWYREGVCTEGGRWGATRLISGGEQSTLMLASRPLYVSSRLSGSGQTSMLSMCVGVQAKQFVVDCWTLRQILDTVWRAWADGVKTFPP